MLITAVYLDTQLLLSLGDVMLQLLHFLPEAEDLPPAGCRILLLAALRTSLQQDTWGMEGLKVKGAEIGVEKQSCVL